MQLLHPCPLERKSYDADPLRPDTGMLMEKQDAEKEVLVAVEGGGFEEYGAGF
jgi:hypothetical protein